MTRRRLSLALLALALISLALVFVRPPGKGVEEGLEPDVPAPEELARAQPTGLVDAPIADEDEREELPIEEAVASPAADSDEPPEEEFLEEAPQDPVQEGNCALRLTVVERDTQEPVATKLSLYRLDAPENDFYGRGDQLQADVQVPREGLLIERLPADEYRAIVHVQTHGESSPAAFEIEGPVTHIQLEVGLPLEVEGWLVIYDEAGRRVQSTDLSPVQRHAHWSSSARARWIRHRPAKVDFIMDSWESSEGSPIFEQERPPTLAEFFGFRLTGIRESSYGGRASSHFVARFKQRTWVRLEIDSERSDLRDPEQLHFAAISGSLSDLLSHILLPDGRDGTAIADYVDAHCQARPAAELESQSPWLDLEVKVHVHHHDYHTLHFSWHPAQGPAPDRMLVLKE